MIDHCSACGKKIEEGEEVHAKYVDDVVISGWPKITQRIDSRVLRLADLHCLACGWFS